MPRFVKSLFGQVVIALVLGVLAGLFAPEYAVKLKPLGDGFIKLIKMIIPVLVFCVVVHGIAGAGDLKRVGRVGVKALIYFEVLTTIALGMGLVLAFVFQPGTGMNVDPAKLDAGRDERLCLERRQAHERRHGRVPHEADTRPPWSTPSQPATCCRCCCSPCCSAARCRCWAIAASQWPWWWTRFRWCCSRSWASSSSWRRSACWAPLPSPSGKYGIGSLKQLGMLVALFYGAVLIFVFVVLGLVMRMSGFSMWKLLRYLREELAIVFATTSSDSVLPQIMAKLRRMGIRDSTVGLVIPTGYSFNLDAFSIYITLAAVFIAQATNTPISMADLLTILAIALVTSKGAHGVPGSAIVVLAATLHAIPAIPAIGLVLVLSVDWFMGIARALGNLIGNCVATVAIAAWEGDIDRERAHAVLDGSYSPDDEPLAEPVVNTGTAATASSTH
jgi:aerobic C4-dicarboxylate transport protein